MSLLKTVLMVNLAFFANLSHALVMPASGESLIVDQRETLYVNDGDIFDLSSLNIMPGGGIDIYGNTQNASFSIIANSFINIGGYLNLFVSETTLKARDISFSGVITLVSGSEITFNIENSLNFSGKVFLDGVPLVSPRGGPLTGPELPPKIQISPITPSAIPEPESYALFLAGLCIIGIVKRRRLA
jgi:hypothetical protein